MARRTSPDDEGLLEPVDPFAPLERAPSQPAEPGGAPPEPARRRGRAVLGAVLAGVVAIVVASLVQPDDGSSTSATTAAPSSTAAPTSTTIVDDTRPPGPTGLFGGAVDVDATLLLGGRNGLRRVDLANGAVVADPVFAGWVDVVAQSGSTTIVRREDQLFVRDASVTGAPFSPLDVDAVVVGPDRVWTRAAGAPATFRPLGGTGAAVDTAGLEIVGATVTHLVGVDGDDRLTLVPVDGDERVRIDATVSQLRATSPTRIAYLADDCSLACTLHLLDVETGDTLDIAVTTDADRRSIGFSPDGTKLALLRYGANTSLVLFDLATGERFQHALTTQGRLEFAPLVANARLTGRTNIAWTPDSSGLVLGASQSVLRYVALAAGAEPVTSRVEFSSPRSFVSLTPAPGGTPAPFADAILAAPLFPEATGLTVAAITADGPAQLFARLELDRGTLSTVAIPEPPASSDDDFGAPPVRVNGGWVATARGAAWLVPDGSDEAQFLAPAAIALRASAGAWLLDTVDDGSMLVRRLAGGQLSEPFPVYGAFWAAVDDGILVRLQASPQSPGTVVAYDPTTGATRDLGITANADVGIVTGGSVVGITDYRNCDSVPCPVTVHDTRDGTPLLEGEAFIEVRAISPDGRWLVSWNIERALELHDLRSGSARPLADLPTNSQVVIAESGLVVAQSFDVAPGDAAALQVVLPGAASSIPLDLGFAMSSFALG